MESLCTFCYILMYYGSSSFESELVRIDVIVVVASRIQWATKAIEEL